MTILPWRHGEQTSLAVKMSYVRWGRSTKVRGYICTKFSIAIAQIDFRKAIESRAQILHGRIGPSRAASRTPPTYGYEYSYGYFEDKVPVPTG